ncbi:helix-turn-helix domain-containing protein [Geminicoccaceae bacterium 1502E]|nr:helix-turn-helix domain-containing protein [Geminicoccaceae bacterium 1502E]
METGMAIGELARRTGTKVQTIRYYEQIGLLPEPLRTEGGQRRYGEAARRRLGFVRHARELGFGLEAIRELLDLAAAPGRDCAHADRIAKANLGDVRRKIARLQALEQELARMVEECRGGRVEECRVLEVLADHDLCLSPAHAPPASPKS